MTCVRGYSRHLTISQRSRRASSGRSSWRPVPPAPRASWGELGKCGSPNDLQRLKFVGLLWGPPIRRRVGAHGYEWRRVMEFGRDQTSHACSLHRSGQECSAVTTNDDIMCDLAARTGEAQRSTLRKSDRNSAIFACAEDVRSTGPEIRFIGASLECNQRRETAQSSHFSPATRANSFALDVTSVAPCRRA